MTQKTDKNKKTKMPTNESKVKYQTISNKIVIVTTILMTAVKKNIKV
jgi:hypothetical protein